MIHLPPPYRKPLAISVGLHILLLAVLAVKLSAPTQFRSHETGPVNIVQAVAVNTTAVMAEVDRIKNQQQIAQQQQQAAARARIAEEVRLQASRQHEQMRLAQLQQEQLRLKQEAALAAAAVLQLKQEKAEKARALAHEKIVREQKLLAQQQQLQQQFMQDQLVQERKQLDAEKEKNQQQMQGVLDQYKAQIIAAIERQWIVPDGANKNLSCVLLIRLAPDGTVLSVDTAQTSGDAVLDRSARDAVFKASKLPVPQDPALFAHFRLLRLTVRPLNVI